MTATTNTMLYTPAETDLWRQNGSAQWTRHPNMVWSRPKPKAIRTGDSAAALVRESSHQKEQRIGKRYG